MAGLPLEDIQGFVLRTYAMPALRVFVLKVEQPAAAGRVLAALAEGVSPLPQITTAVTWTTKPDACVNVGFTHAGLAALGLTGDALASFPEEFVQGPVQRAARVGDVGESAPENWKGKLANPDVHALVFVFAQTEDAITATTEALRAQFADGPAFSEVSVHDARRLPGDVAHFGYRDGFAQPSVQGGPPPMLPDVLPEAPAGEFVLGYQSQWKDFSYPVPQPETLGRNGSFVAFRVLAQDCAAFEQFLTRASTETGLDRELIAAKLCGRWRNGVPLALSPTTADANLPMEQYNAFDYATNPAVPDVVKDPRGDRCPIGAHIRRMNPRNSTVAGSGGLKRRIVRRGLPYGPPFDLNNPDDGIERGLLGLFIGASIKDQFEFLMGDWANKGLFAPGLQGTKDPVLGDNSSPDATFLMRVDGRNVELAGLSRFVTCRGGAYAFLPSVTGLRHLASVAGSH